MKVLMLGWELPPHNSGGLGIACYQLCKKLSEKGADIEFILPYKGHKEIKFMNVVSAIDRTPSSIYNSISAYESTSITTIVNGKSITTSVDQYNDYEHFVSSLVENKSYDMIHAHDWLTFRAALIAKEKLNVPFIAHVHSIERNRAGGNAGNPFVREIEETAFWIADRIIAVSQHTKNEIIKDYSIPADKISIAHNSLDLEAYEDISETNAYAYLNFMKAKGYKVVTSVGRLTIQKGLSNLMQAAKHVVDREPKTIFLIVGAGELYNELIEQAATLGIGSNVIFTGFQRGKNWRDAFSVGDLFVMPSVSEPFGLTPLESVLYGTPALISHQSGVAEVLNNVLKVDFWDVNAMADKIVGALRSDSLRAELHTNASSELQNMSWHDSAEKILNIYEHHLEGVAV